MADIPHSRFLGPRKILLLVLLGLLIYSVSLMLWVPAGWLWQWARPHVDLPPGMAIEQVAGQLWSGGIRLRTQGHAVQGNWQFAGLYTNDRWLPLDWQVQTAQSGLTGDLWLSGLDQWHVSAQGQINIPEFSQQIRRSGGAVIEGDVRVTSLRLSGEEESVTQADGLATWPGGRVSWRLNNELQEAMLPPMEARLDDQSGQFGLDISTAAEPAPVVTAMLGSNGMARIEVYRRMLDLVNQPWAGDAAPDDVVFSVEQPLTGGF